MYNFFSNVGLYVSGRGRGKTYKLLDEAKNQPCYFLVRYKHNYMYLETLETYKHVKLISVEEYIKLIILDGGERLPVIIDELDYFLGEIFKSDVLLAISSDKIKMYIPDSEKKFGFTRVKIDDEISNNTLRKRFNKLWKTK